MSVFKRLCRVVFALAGIFSLCALGLTWLGPWRDVASALMVVDGYWYALQACMAVTAVGLVVLLFQGLFARKTRTVQVATVDGGAITVTKSAVASQAAHIVEALGVGEARSVDVSASRSGQVRVDVKVTPFESIDVTDEAPTLHEGLVAGLSAMVGEHLGAVNVEFLEPQHASSLVVLDEQGEGDEDEAYAGEEPAASSDDTGDITIPMNVEREA